MPTSVKLLWATFIAAKISGIIGVIAFLSVHRMLAGAMLSLDAALLIAAASFAIHLCKQVPDQHFDEIAYIPKH